MKPIPLIMAHISDLLAEKVRILSKKFGNDDKKAWQDFWGAKDYKHPTLTLAQTMKSWRYWTEGFQFVLGELKKRGIK